MVKAEAVEPVASKRGVSPAFSRFCPLSSLPSRFCTMLFANPAPSKPFKGWGEGGYPSKRPEFSRLQCIATDCEQIYLRAETHRATCQPPPSRSAARSPEMHATTRWQPQV